jgi:NAD(P)-dependent dehydrogenase (short-subunit alcohol dehydrogenase family)
MVYSGRFIWTRPRNGPFCSPGRDHVIGTGRNIRKAASDNPEFENIGGQWLQLDVAQAEAQKTVAQLVPREEERLGNSGPIHWVVVNNAGNTLLGAVEDMSEDQISQYLQINLFGLIRV